MNIVTATKIRSHNYSEVFLNFLLIHFVQPEEGFIWVETCSCNCVFIPKSCIWQIIMNLTTSAVNDNRLKLWIKQQTPVSYATVATSDSVHLGKQNTHAPSIIAMRQEVRNWMQFVSNQDDGNTMADSMASRANRCDMACHVYFLFISPWKVP
jgi:hypothetical protein